MISSDINLYKSTCAALEQRLLNMQIANLLKREYSRFYTNLLYYRITFKFHASLNTQTFFFTLAVFLQIFTIYLLLINSWNFQQFPQQQQRIFGNLAHQIDLSVRWHFINSLIPFAFSIQFQYSGNRKLAQPIHKHITYTHTHTLTCREKYLQIEIAGQAFNNLHIKLFLLTFATKKKKIDAT